MIREIPRAFEYVCDVCGAKHLQENAGGHYTNSRPAGWAHLKFNGASSAKKLAHDPLEELLCEVCYDHIHAAVIAAIKERTP